MVYNIIKKAKKNLKGQTFGRVIDLKANDETINVYISYLARYNQEHPATLYQLDRMGDNVQFSDIESLYNVIDSLPYEVMEWLVDFTRTNQDIKMNFILEAAEEVDRLSIYDDTDLDDFYNDNDHHHGKHLFDVDRDESFICCSFYSGSELLDEKYMLNEPSTDELMQMMSNLPEDDTDKWVQLVQFSMVLTDESCKNEIYEFKPFILEHVHFGEVEIEE